MIFTTDSDINKIDFSIENLEIDELVLLLGENYQEVLKKINFQSLDIKGEYVKENLNIEDLVITLADKSQINIEGNINLSNFISSDLSIRGQNISSDNLFQMIPWDLSESFGGALMGSVFLTPYDIYHFDPFFGNTTSPQSNPLLYTLLNLSLIHI